MNRQSGTLIGLLGSTLALLLAGPVQAGNDGEIILTRDVQPRVATRKEMVPDPNPKQVYGSPDAYLHNGVRGSLGNELEDSDFARISSGMSVTQRVLVGQPAQSGNPGNQHLAPTTSGIGAHAGGGNNGGIAGRVNQSVQQGLRPLTQVMPGQ